MAFTFMLCGISSGGIQVVCVSFKPQVKFQGSNEVSVISFYEWCTCNFPRKIFCLNQTHYRGQIVLLFLSIFIP